MSLYKPKKSPYWHYDFVIDGRRFHGSTEERDKTAARRIEDIERGKARAEVRGDIKPPITLDLACGRYAQEVSDHQSSSSTSDSQAAHLIRVLGADVNLHEITDADLARYIATRRGESPWRYRKRPREERPPVAPATINRELQLFGRIVNRARRVWKCAVPNLDWGAHRLEEPDERVRELSPDEERRLFEHLRPDFQPLVEFAFLAGLRAANMINLHPRNVDFANAIATVRMKSKKPGGKSHVIPLTPRMVAILANEIGNHPDAVFTFECQRDHGPFRRKGQRYPFSKDGWRRVWMKALKDAGIEDFRFHDLRHTYGTRLVRETGNLKLVQRGLGHTSINSTVRYAHATIDDLRAGMTAVEAPKDEKSPEYSRTGTDDES